MFRDFPTFSRICIFFLLTLLTSNLSLLSASSLLCFSSVHIVGSLTSKLPSIIIVIVIVVVVIVIVVVVIVIIIVVMIVFIYLYLFM